MSDDVFLNEGCYTFLSVKGWNYARGTPLLRLQAHRQSTHRCRDGSLRVRPPVSVEVWWQAPLASAIASRRRSASATTRSIKPKLAASFDVEQRPVRINSIAAFRPTLRGKAPNTVEGWHDPDINLGLRECSGLRRKRDVSRFRQFASPAERNSIYRRDNRLGVGFHAPGHLMARAHEVHNGVRWSSLHVFLKRRDVGSSTERSSSSRYHNNNANGRVEFDAIETHSLCQRSIRC